MFWQSLISIFLALTVHAQHNQLPFSTFKKLAAELPELPIPSMKDNPVYPNYIKFIETLQPNRFSTTITRFLQKLGIMRPPEWSLDTFETLLIQQVKARKNLPYEHILASQPEPKTSYVLWGPLNGSFHSLVRTLDSLYAKGIINEELTIIEPNHYFVFFGDAIGQSAYNIETLMLILSIMQKNPHHVIYLWGNQEHQEWRFYIKDELKAKGANTSLNSSITQLLTVFFDTLPLELYLRYTTQHNKPSWVRLSYKGLNGEAPSYKTTVAHILANAPLSSTMQTFSYDHVKTPEYLPITTLFKAHLHDKYYYISAGLGLEEPEEGATTWELLSSPNEQYQRMYEFYDDAYCTLQTTQPRNNWLITLYNRDARTNQPFESLSFDCMTGKLIEEKEIHSFLNKPTPPIEPPITHPQLDHGTEIVIGSTMDMKRSIKPLTERIRRGLMLRISEENLLNNELSEFIRVVILDDRNTPHLTSEATRVLQSRFYTNSVIASVGTATHATALPLLEEKKLYSFFPSSGSSMFRHEKLATMIHYKPSYDEESAALIDHAINELHLKRFAIFYQEDALGSEVRDYIVNSLKKSGKDITFVSAGYIRNQLNVQQAANVISKFDPDAIFLISMEGPAAALIDSLGVAFFANTIVLGLSCLGDAFRQFLHNKGLDVTIASAVPNPETSNLPIAQAFRHAHATYSADEPLQSDAFEGYIAASLFIEGLKKATQPITPEQLITFYETMHNYHFMGLQLTFDPQQRSLSKTIWLDNGKKNWPSYKEGQKIQDSTPEV